MFESLEKVEMQFDTFTSENVLFSYYNGYCTWNICHNFIIQHHCMISCINCIYMIETSPYTTCFSGGALKFHHESM